MKKKLLILTATIFIFGCSNYGKKKKESDNKSDTISIFEPIEIDYDYERIQLLSIIHGIDKDTLKKIISDYDNSTPSIFTRISLESTEDKTDYYKTIDSLSILYKINKTDIAKIIYDYKYNNSY
jgi:hypothetical protein